MFEFMQIMRVVLYNTGIQVILVCPLPHLIPFSIKPFVMIEVLICQEPPPPLDELSVAPPPPYQPPPPPPPPSVPPVYAAPPRPKLPF